MKTIEESVVTAMDGSDIKLYPFLPYILQDLWEIGADPDAIIKMITKHLNNFSELKILDLGCGKGAVSVKVAEKLGCTCYGIDAIPEFIETAQQKAQEYKVSHLCTFVRGDIREKVKHLSGFDIIILGAIGPVFGDYFETLTTLSKCIKRKGIFIIDDGYIDDNSDYIHPLIVQQSTIMQQIEKAGMELVESDIMERENIKDSNRYIFDKLKKRCYELIEKYPDNKNLFLGYIRNQETENDVLENKIIATTMMFKFKN